MKDYQQEDWEFIKLTPKYFEAKTKKIVKWTNSYRCDNLIKMLLNAVKMIELEEEDFQKIRNKVFRGFLLPKDEFTLDEPFDEEKIGKILKFIFKVIRERNQPIKEEMIRESERNTIKPIKEEVIHKKK